MSECLEVLSANHSSIDGLCVGSFCRSWSLRVHVLYSNACMRVHASTTRQPLSNVTLLRIRNASLSDAAVRKLNLAHFDHLLSLDLSSNRLTTFRHPVALTMETLLLADNRIVNSGF